MFFQRVALPDLIDLCRVLRHQLGAGLAIHHVLKKTKRAPADALWPDRRPTEQRARQGSSLGRASTWKGTPFRRCFCRW